MRALANDKLNRANARFFEFSADIPLAEFDLGGVLYHANYFRYYERAREAFLEKQNTSYAQLIAQGYHLAVTESQQRFLAPIFYGEQIKLQLTASELKRTSVKLHYQLFNKTKLIHHAWTTHVLVQSDGTRFKPTRFPTELAEAFAEITQG